MLDRRSGPLGTISGVGSEEHAAMRPPAGRRRLARSALLGRSHGRRNGRNLAAAGCRVIGYVRRQERRQDSGVRCDAHNGHRRTVRTAEDRDQHAAPTTPLCAASFRRPRYRRIGRGPLARRHPPLDRARISTAAAAECAGAEHGAAVRAHVAAPVFGNPDAARARQLFIIAAGAAIDVERCRPLTDNLGQTLVVGEDPVLANLIKLLGNIMTATTLEVLGETVARASKARLRSKALHRYSDLDDVRGSCPTTVYGNKIVEESYAPGFVMPLALKDVRLALGEAERAGVSMPSATMVRDRLTAGIRPRPCRPRLDGARPCRPCGGIGNRRSRNVNREVVGPTAERVRATHSWICRWLRRPPPRSRQIYRRDVVAADFTARAGAVALGQAEPRITLQKLLRVKVGSLSARTSALTLPNVVCGLCLMPS